MFGCLCFWWAKKGMLVCWQCIFVRATGLSSHWQQFPALSEHILDQTVTMHKERCKIVAVPWAFILLTLQRSGVLRVTYLTAFKTCSYFCCIFNTKLWCTMNYSCTVCRLFSHVSRERAGLCSQHCIGRVIFGSFAVCVHMETELREIVFLI